jgi:2''-5'' RNA ligase
MIRTFIALEINAETRDAIMDDVAELKHDFRRIKWVGPESLHVTLKFLGDVGEKDLNDIFSAVDEVAARHGPFVVDVETVGVFPNWRAPRVVWAGCGEGKDEIVSLQKNIESNLAELGYEPEKRHFNPHITLGRIKLPADGCGLFDAARGMLDTNYGFMDVDAVTVFMSEMKRSGPVYTPMHHARLSS